MPDVSVLVPEVRADVAGCPKQTVLAAIRRAHAEFCDRSGIWRTTLESPVYFVRGVREGQAQLPPETSIARIVWLRRQGAPLEPHEYSPSGRDIILRQPPQQDFEAQARVVLRPDPHATRMDDALYARWSEAILHGALWRLMSRAGQQWTNAEGALYHKAQFDREIGRASARAAQDFFRDTDRRRSRNGFM